MRRFGRSSVWGKRNAACAAVLIVFSFILLWGCQEPRFKVGDPVGVPPLPPSDIIIGTFDKAKKSDLTDTVYQLKDLPGGSGQPIGISFDGDFRLFFHHMDFGAGPSVKMGTVQPASPYISTGDDGIAATSAMGGDIQGEVVSVGAKPGATSYNYKSRIGIPAGMGEPNRQGVRPGSDGKIQTQCIFDDNTRYPKRDEIRVGSKFPDLLDPDEGIIPISLKDGIYSGVDGIMQSGLAGDDVQRYYAGETFNPAGTVVIVSPGADEALETIPGGGDDVQSFAPGSSLAGATDRIIVEPGGDGVLQTCPLNDDYVKTGEQVIRAGGNKRADSIVADDTIATVDLGAGPVSVIIDGGNGIAESGIGRNDKQIIPVGQGKPDTVAIIASRDPGTGAVRQLNTTPNNSDPTGDDEIIDPGKGNLAGDYALHPDNKNTVVDPDGNEIVENYATVDDGEYFSWEGTNLNFANVPPPPPGGIITKPPIGLNVPLNIQTYMPSYRGDAPIKGFTPNYYTFDIIKRGSSELVAYVSNGFEIYRFESNDGTTWSLNPGTPVLSPGGNGRATDPVILAGYDGICESTVLGDDVRNRKIDKGKAKPDSIAIFSGRDAVVQSQPGGDDWVDGMFIRTGPNGIRESLPAGDDWEVLPFGQGQPDTACILAGPDGERASSITGDDRPPFLDVDSDSTASASPIYADYADSGEPAVSVGLSGGFDAFAVTHPFIFRKDGKFYMLYTGFGALSEPEARRPSEEARRLFGPCQRPGLDRMMDNAAPNSVCNADNTPGVVVAPRIGVAVSNDGITWKKKKAPVIGLGNTCAELFDLSLLASLGIDIEDLLGVKPFLVASMAFDYSGAFGARVRSDIAADGDPVYSMIYGGLHFTRPFESGLLGDLRALAPAPNGRERYAGLNKTGLGLARSFSITSGWQKLKDNNPIFSGGMFYSSTSEQPASILQVGEGYTGFFGAFSTGTLDNLGDEELYIGYSYRYGTVYSLCMTGQGQGAGVPQRAVAGLLLLLLPAIILLARKVFVRVRNPS